MSFDKMLDHCCDIYHIVKSAFSPGYNLPKSLSFSYPNEPDLKKVPCHFGVKEGIFTVIQGQPNGALDAKIKLTLLPGTDIRCNDKIVDCRNGYGYIAEIPGNIRGHHMMVYLHRDHTQRPL